MTVQPPHTVVVSIPHGGSAGNVLRTGLLRRLLEATDDVRVLLLSPLVKDPAFTSEFAHPRVVFQDLPPHRPQGLEARLLAIVQAAYLASDVTESVRIRRAEAIAKGSIRWMRTKRILARAFAPSMVQPATRWSVSDRLVSHPAAEALFDRHRPVLYVASSPGLIFSELPLLRTAARRRVRSMAMDPSWDNFTNKLLPVRRVDRLVVWNDLMRDQAIDLHGYQPDEIRVAGVPQFDGYFKSLGGQPGLSREAFFRKIGADPSRRLVTMTTTPRELYPHHDHVLRVGARLVGLHRCSAFLQGHVGTDEAQPDLFRDRRAQRPGLQRVERGQRAPRELHGRQHDVLQLPRVSHGPGSRRADRSGGEPDR